MDANEFAEYQKAHYSPYSAEKHFLTEEEKSTIVQVLPKPPDRRTVVEKTQDLFKPYGGLPGQRTQMKSE